MQPLVIEYVFEGHQRGYNFTSSTSSYSDDDLKLIWRNAMPRGQGWAQYAGVRILKCFPVNHRVAACVTEVTDLRDENGRGGIRRTQVEVMRHIDYVDYLADWLLSLPPHIQPHLERLPTLSQRMKIANKALPRPRRENQLVLLHPYQSPAAWLLMEGLVIKLALSPVGPMKRWGRVVPFTTFALTHREESALVGLPDTHSHLLDSKTPTLRIRVYSH